MNYQLLINNFPVFSGNVAATFCLILIVIILAVIGSVYAAKYLRKKLQEDEILKSEFLTIIAHKFRTPLTSVKWAVESLLSGEQDPYKKESYSEIREANENLIKLTGTLIELTETNSAAASSYAFEEVNLCDFVRLVATNLKGVFHEKNIFFGVRCLVSDIQVKVDKARMEFVLQTLFENACNYSPPGRDVDVTVGVEKNKAVVAVVDHGIGIDPRDLPRIFTKFFRTEAATTADTEGVGIGLYLAKSVMQRHKGTIDVYSEGLDKGTMFRVTLPVVK